MYLGATPGPFFSFLPEVQSGSEGTPHKRKRRGDTERVEERMIQRIDKDMTRPGMDIDRQETNGANGAVAWPFIRPKDSATIRPLIKRFPHFLWYHSRRNAARQSS